jgi:epoxyqueuosine reductase
MVTPARDRSRHWSWPVRHAFVSALGSIVRPVLSTRTIKWLRHVPSGPAVFRRRYKAPLVWWPDRPPLEIPDDLLSYAGVRRDEVAAQDAFDAEPLHSFHHNFGAAVLWALAELWQSLVPVGPRLVRSVDATKRTGGKPAIESPGWTATEAVDWLAKEARKIGMSTIGFAPYDERYTFAENVGEIEGQNVIVCVLEQKWEPTQTLPGPVGEQTALSTNAEIIDMTALLATAMSKAGYQARAHSTEGVAVIHHYGVEAGVGQMGINGQLLTPEAGSRCRLAMITTDMPLVFGGPRDFGIPAICDGCQACVRRCPAGAIPVKRTWHRGIEKSKLNLSRCFPLVAKVNGCSVCVKVCPIQRYGLESVLEHRAETGLIKGVGTDELEGYDWPLDGLHYQPGEKPKLEPSFFELEIFPVNRDGTRSGDATSVDVPSPLT